MEEIQKQLRVSQNVTNFLKMIPPCLKGSTVASLDNPESPATPTPVQRQVRQQTPEERLRWTQAIESSEQVVTKVTVRLRGESVEERVKAIVQSAKDCGRLSNSRAEKVYQLLVTATLAHHVAVRPGVNVTPNRLVTFLVVDDLTLLLDMARATVHRAFGDLKNAGLVDKRAWHTDSGVRIKKKETDDVPAKAEPRNIRTAAAGVLVDVVLSPGLGTKARVMKEDLQRRDYRNLDADRQTGRTAWQWTREVKENREQLKQIKLEIENLVGKKAPTREVGLLREREEQLRQSYPIEQEVYKINHLLRWTLLLPNQNPVTLTVSERQETVYRLGELRDATPEKLAALIDERARAICIAVDDSVRNLNFWRRLLWRLTRLEQTTQPGILQSLSAALQRLLADLREWRDDSHNSRPLRNPAALLISRLKMSVWWNELNQVKTFIS